MASDFNENTRVQVPAAFHLCRLGYTYVDTLPRYEDDCNILTDVFLSQLGKLNPGYTEQDCKNYLLKIKTCLANDDLGREFYSLLSANSGIRMIDFEHPERNTWHVTTEFSCENTDTQDSFRPDITCFVNGLPLAFIEVKKPNNYEGMKAEFDRINRRFANRAFRRFFNIVQLMIFSNNQEYESTNRVPVQGAFYCCTAKDTAFYNVFREAEKDFAAKYPYQDVSADVLKKILRHRNCLSLASHPEFETNIKPVTPTNRIITSMLSRERFLYLLRYGFAYVESRRELADGTEVSVLQKHIMRYQQLFATLAVQRSLDRGHKGGIIWHTQGSGKTAFAYYSVKVLTDYYARKNTAVKFYFIVDRLSLMEQAADEFVSRGLLVRTADTRENLMKDFRSCELVENTDGRAEIMVVNIQKFEEDYTPVDIASDYGIALQRVFFIDEAHRGYNPKGSFLANLLDADKNAVRIAMTGTPLLKEERESWRVFGDYIDTYYYDKSIADGYTLRLMREPVQTVYKERLESILDKLAGAVEVKKSDIDRDKIIEHESYLKALIDYIVNDLRLFRIEKGDVSVAAMVVCKTNTQARKFYELWKNYFNQNSVDEVVYRIHDMSSYAAEGKFFNENKISHKISKPLRASLILHDEGDKQERKEYIEEFKRKETIDVLIVNQMLLTGFDAPRLKKLYLGRTLDGHDLLQALTRVNRPYKDFKYGYVVDFVDIRENFDATNERYLRELNRTNDADETGETKPVAQTLLANEDKEEIHRQMNDIKSVLWYYDCSNAEEFRIQLDEIYDKSKLYELRSTLENAKALLNIVRAQGDDELKQKVKSLLPGMIPALVTEVTNRINRINLLENTEHKEDVAGIINLALSELDFEFKKGLAEELEIVINDLREKIERVQREFESNFDKKEENYVNLAEEFRAYFRKKGFVPASVKDAKESIHYMNEVMNKIKEINRRNNLLKKKYGDDERFVRVHKRIQEENAKRSDPLISREDIILCENLYQLKCTIDSYVDLNPHILAPEGEPKFKRDVQANLSRKLYELGISAAISDKKYLTNLIAQEYINQYASYGV